MGVTRDKKTKNNCYTISEYCKKKRKMRKLKQKLLILDLDETLIHTSEKKTDNFEYIYDHDGHKYYIAKRPELDRFIDSVGRYYEIGIWTAGNKKYMDFIVSKILSKRPRIMYHKNMTDIEWISKKDNIAKTTKRLEKLWKRTHYDKSNTVVIDDNPETFSKNSANGIEIKPWEGDINDKELLEVEKILVFAKDMDVC